MANMQQETPMDIDSAKRKIVDPDTKQEVSTSKKPRFELKPEVKEQCLKFIALAHISVHIGANLNTNDHLTNISVGTQVMNIVFTGHTILRQSAQSINGSMRNKVSNGTPTITIAGEKRSIQIETVLSILRQSASVCGLAYDNTENKAPLGGKNWYGIAGPFQNFLTGFSLRLRELRLRHSEFPYTKEADVSSSYAISKYGLSRAHHILLEGIRFPPERSSMVQSIGPMTYLLCYLHSTGPFEEKFKEAVKRSLAHIPNIDSILKVIKGKPFNTISPIISTLADICIICTPRNVNRAFPPPNVFALYMWNGVEYVDSNGPKSLSATAVTLGLEDVPIYQRVKALTFTGAGDFNLYNIASAYQWNFTSKITPEESSQIIFHAWFGTYKEDLGILKSITNTKNWFTRDDFKDRFQKMNTEGTTKEVDLIRMTHFSNLTSASQTGELAQGYKQVASIPVFSGQRTRHFSNDFFKYLEESSPTTSGATTIQSVEADLSGILTGLVDKLRKNKGKQEAGTTQWYPISQLNFASVLDHSSLVPEVNMRIAEEGLYFLG